MKKFYSILMALVVMLSVNAQTSEVVFDINTSDFSNSWANSFFKYQEKVYFSAYDNFNGQEMWVYDGVNQPELFANLSYYEVGSYPRSFIMYNGDLIFTAEGSGYGSEMYIFNGIDQPQILYDINPTGATFPEFYIELNSKLYFRGTSPTLGVELFEYDGQNMPTVVADINNGAASSFLAHLTVFNNEIYFSANDGSNGAELWKFDGANASMLADINLGSNSSSPNNLIVFNNKLYFTASSPTLKIYEYTGSGSPVELTTFPANCNKLFVFNNNLYFQARPASQVELWTWNGIDAPYMVTTLDANDTNFSIEKVAVFDDEFYFRKKDDEGRFALYKCDVDHNVTQAVSPLYSYTSTEFGNITRIDNRVFFHAKIDNIGLEMAVYDKTTGLCETFNLNQQNADGEIDGMVEFNQKLYFSAQNGNSTSLWSHDPVLNITEQVSGTDNIEPYDLIVYKNKLYFTAYDQDEYCRLFVFDGTNNPYIVNPNCTDCIDPGNFVIYNNLLYFQMYHPDYGSELWKYDGETQPEIAYEFVAGSADGDPIPFIVFQDNLIIRAFSESIGSEIYSFDGTTMTLIGDIYEGPLSSYPNDFAILNNVLYFGAKNNGNDNELWKYDGINPPQRVADIYPGTNGSNPYDLVVFNNKLCFTATNGTHGYEFWEYDGTNQPLMRADILPNTQGSEPNYRTVVNGKMYFAASSYTSNKELWVYDGINSPSIYVDVYPGPVGSAPEEIVVFDNMLYFYALNYPYGKELMRTCYSYEQTITETACNSFEFYGNTYNQSGTYNIIATSPLGCEISYSLDLTILENSTSEITETACNSFILNNITYSSSGVYYQTFENILGCDSIITINLIVENLDYDIVQVDNEIAVTADNATYQWLDCNNSFAPIEGETNAVFTAIENGSYAVGITSGTCYEISDCYNVTILNVENSNDSFSIYPNPTSGNVIIGFSNFEVRTITLFDIMGRVMDEKVVANQFENIDFSIYPDGIYMISIQTQDEIFTTKIIKE